MLQDKVRYLLSWLQEDSIAPELVALASEVAAAAASARKLLAGVPDGAARQQLLDECDVLERAAEEVVNPRSQLQDFPASHLDDAFENFMQYQVQASVLRAAAMRLAGKHERPKWVLRRRRA